jgi:hypothetical protein
MAENENKEFRKEEIYSKAVRAGKRTYFFDVKATRSGENYLTITESKRRFSNEQGKFFYEKHKIFLYKEDFEKFANGFEEVVTFIQTGQAPEPEQAEPTEETREVKDIHTDVEFEDLGPTESEKEE